MPLLLVLIGAINYIDRATLAIANPLSREELGLSVAEMGLLLYAFLGAWALVQLPASGATPMAACEDSNAAIS